MYEELLRTVKSLIDSKDEGSSKMLTLLYDAAVKRYGVDVADALLDMATVIMDGSDNGNSDRERGNGGGILDSDAVEHHPNEEHDAKVSDGGAGARLEPDNGAIRQGGDDDHRPGDSIKRRYLPGDGSD